MLADLKSRYDGWALITGATSGIGLAFAEALTAASVDCLLLSNEPEALARICAELTARHAGQAVACDVDLRAGHLVDQVRACVGERHIGLLINNASFGRVGAFATHDLATYDAMLAVNARAYVALTHTFLPAMQARRRGALIYLSSINAVAPGIANSAVYTATKAFDFSFACGIWCETLATGIDVQLVLPGPTRTGFQAEAGTHVASWAQEPAEVASGALDALGDGRLLYVSGDQNQLIAAISSALALERRVMAASMLLQGSLIEGTL